MQPQPDQPEKTGSIIPSEAARAYIYRVLVAVGAIAVATGKISDNDLVLYLALAATILGVGLAAVNTKTSQ